MNRDHQLILNFRQVDPEARLGLPSGRHTTPSLVTSLFGGALLMLLVVAAGLVIRRPTGDAVSDAIRLYIWDLIMGYKGLAPTMVFLACWSFSFLCIKMLKIRAQRRALELRLMPTDPGFVLTAATSQKVLQAIESGVEGAAHFLYLKRIISSLRSMRNVGRVADVDDMLQSAAANDQSILESGYTMLKGFVWAIPVLGFIGTVLGLSDAMRSFNQALAPAANGQSADVKLVTQGLVKVLQGLDVAFVTTGEALILVFIIHLIHVFVRDADEALLDDAREEAHEQIGARVRLDQVRVP
jgi:biopolymer transport protein ExbB/TolQ